MREFLGLDTSNYTTSCAIFDAENGTVRQAKKLLPVKAGMAGLRQSDAVFHHTRQLPEVIQNIIAESTTESNWNWCYHSTTQYRRLLYAMFFVWKDHGIWEWQP